MKLKVKSWEQLASEGFKIDYPYCYRGSKNDNNGAKIPYHWRDCVLGKNVSVGYVKDFGAGKIDCVVDGRKVTLPAWIFVECLDLTKINEPTAKKFPFSSEPAQHVPGIGFRFPCAFDDLDEKQAVTVAKWVIEQAGIIKKKRKSTRSKKREG